MPTICAALALMTTLMMAGFFVIPFISPYIVANVGVREQDLPWIYFFGGLATVFTSRLTGRLADRYGKRQVFIIAGLLSVAPTLALTNLPRVPLAVVICVTTLFMVLGNGRWVCALALVTATDPAADARQLSQRELCRPADRDRTGHAAGGENHRPDRRTAH